MRLCADLAREAGAAGVDLTSVVVLDGGDAGTEVRLRETGAEVLVKEPPGPHKGAALSWAVAELDRSRPGFLESHRTVVVLDADVRLPPGWLAALRIPEGAEAFQGPIRAEGVPAPGAARAEAFSLAVALLVDDPGRDAAGLPVRLRGKAMGFTPRAFRAGPASATRTTAEDSEATLLLLEQGIRVRCLSGPETIEERTDPGRMGGARSRWFGGHAARLLRRAPLVASLLVRGPRETLSLLLDLYLRPRALVLPALLGLFVACALVSAVSLARGRGAGLFPLGALLAAAVLVFEGLHLRKARRLLGFGQDLPPVTPGDLARMAAVWVRAAARGLFSPGRWHRGSEGGE